MCCGRGCTPHRPLVNGDRQDVQLGGLSVAETPSKPAEAPKPVGVESRRNGRWRYGTSRPMNDGQQLDYSGAVTELPRVVHVQAETMTSALPESQTVIRRTAARDTGAGGCTP